MSQPDNDSSIDRRRGRPTTYDSLELAAIYTDGINGGKSVAVISLETAELLAARAGNERTRRTINEVKKQATRIERAMYRARKTLLQPWEPAIGKGILEYDGTTHVTAFGDFTIMGRLLPKPIGIEPRTPAKPGRPKKASA